MQFSPILAPCQFCGGYGHNHNSCPQRAAQQYCAYCQVNGHNLQSCMAEGSHTRASKVRSIHALENEPKARAIIVEYDYNLPMRHLSTTLKTCDTHIADNFHNNETTFPQTILKDRTLMPLCQDCVTGFLKEQNLPSATSACEDTGYAIDQCVCAYNIIKSPDCYRCHIDGMYATKESYIRSHRRNTLVPHTNQQAPPSLSCKCGKPPMQFPDEVLRLCICCEQIVGVPAHQFDGSTHLGCPVWGASVAVAEQMAEQASWMGNGRGCGSRHPVKVVGELIPAGALRATEQEG